MSEVMVGTSASYIRIIVVGGGAWGSWSGARTIREWWVGPHGEVIQIANRYYDRGLPSR